MRRWMVVLGAFTLLLGLSGAAGAYVINYDSVAAGNEFTSPNAGFLTENFNSGFTWAWTGDGMVVSGSLSGKYAAPAGVGGVPDASQYVTVPIDTAIPAINTLTATPGGSYNYIGLWWGSVDDYNVLKFYSGGNLVETITGAQAINPSDANGNQTAPSTNLYVNIYDLPFFDSFSMTSDRYAFEADNITVGVPEPATLLLLGSGLLGLALTGAKKKYRM